MNYLKFSLTVTLVLVFAGLASAQSCHTTKTEGAACCAAAKAEANATVDASLTTITFAVSGNCGMCQRTIETAAKSLTGVQQASWDADAQTITVSYDEASASVDTIKETIAAAGYDTAGVRASDEAYSALHGCCQYERVRL